MERSLILRMLPPLILHPFADAGGPGKLVESSRANLKLQGLLTQGEATREDDGEVCQDWRGMKIKREKTNNKSACANFTQGTSKC